LKTEIPHVFEEGMLYCDVRGDSQIWFITSAYDHLMDKYHNTLPEPFKQELP